jgi:phosphoserine aminotransferase
MILAYHLEMSHRSKDFVAVMEEARTIVLELQDLKGKVHQALFYLVEQV